MQPTITLDYLLQHIVAIMAKQSDQVLQEQLGLTLAQYKVLRLLRTDSSMIQREAARHLGQTEASVSRQVRLMAERGMVQSLRAPGDKREHPVAITPKGEKLLLAATHALNAYYEPILAAVPRKQSKHLYEGLDALHGALCSAGHGTAEVL